MFLIAAETIAKHVTDDDIQKGSLYPPLSVIRECSLDIAIGITKYAYSKGLASLYPEPSDKKKWLREQLYNFNYESSMPITWPWPEMPKISTRPLQPTILHVPSAGPGTNVKK
jgi:malate dehydrogenase (oxaloacetate-decarboxylating)(NADP+)